jgi:NAD(P)-dependent dehydrogenase (short-subunit alcohol dehydrogenase family)
VTKNGLQGQTALITGAAKRIGRAIAVALADEGANIVIHYRSSAEEAEELQVLLGQQGATSWRIQADFEDAGETDTLIGRALEMTGSLDILINSASMFPTSTLENVRFEQVVQNVQVNAWAPFVLSREFARRVGRGKIVNLLDTALNDYDWSHVAYYLSKQMFSVLTKMMAIEFAPEITVNGIAPGLILPPPGKEESHLRRLIDTVPLKRRGFPEEIAKTVIYLLENDFVTGHVIPVDGGRHLGEVRNGSDSD